MDILMGMELIILILLSLPLILLLKLYAGKSIGDPNRPPVKGTVFHMLLHLRTLYDYQIGIARDQPTFRLLAPEQSECYTAEPENVEHVLKTKFDKYAKGKYQTDIFRDLFGLGIFAVDGDRWRHQRKLASFEFSTRVLRDFSCVVFRNSAVNLLRVVSNFARTKQPFDVYEVLMRNGLDTIFKVGFGVDLCCLDGSNREGLNFMRSFDEASSLVFLRFMDPVWKLKRALNIGSEATLKTHIKLINNFVHNVISHKRNILQHSPNSMEKEDILSRFLVESERDPDNMDEAYLRDIILNFILAGKDTTASTIAWFLYTLSTNPLVQLTIIQELTRVLPDSTTSSSVHDFVSLITDETLEKMPYLHAALTETLRLYPVVPVDGRTALSDDVLPSGHKIKKGDNVYYLAYAMARMPYVWGDDAEEFRPERWLHNGVFKPESPFKFITFHAGPRICLGKDFAYRQMKIVVLALIRFFEFQLADEAKAVTYKTTFTLHIDGGLHVLALPRNQVETPS